MWGYEVSNSMEKEDDILLLTEQFNRINNKINQLRNIPRSFNGTDPVNLCAINVIDAISKHSEANVTEIARILGITKGAVSQMVSKLSAKGFVVKTKVGHNDKDVILRLTEDGQKVFEGHKKMQAAMYADLRSAFNDVTPVEIELARKIFDIIEGYMDQYQQELR